MQWRALVRVRHMRRHGAASLALPPTALIGLRQEALVINTTKHVAWKYFGSMFMETKPNGKTGMSFHKTLGLLMLLWAMVMWTPKAWQTGDLTQSAVYVLLALLGLKAVSKVSERFGNQPQARSQPTE